MTLNEGAADRIIRLIVAAAAVLCPFTGGLTLPQVTASLAAQRPSRGSHPCRSEVPLNGHAVLVSWWAGFGSVAGIILLVFAGWMFVTGTVGVCLGYWLVKISTRPSPHRITTLRAATHH